MPGLDWLIVGVIAVLSLMAWTLGNDIAKAHSTLISLGDTLTRIAADVDAIRDRVAGVEKYDDVYGPG